MSYARSKKLFAKDETIERTNKKNLNCREVPSSELIPLNKLQNWRYAKNLEDGDGVGHDEVDTGGLLEEHVAQGQQERLH